MPKAEDFRRILTKYFQESENANQLGVAENTNGRFWFDLRQVNLARLTSKAYLLVRIVPNLFVFAGMTDINSLLTTELMDNRPNSGNVWGIHLEFDKARNTAKLFNLKAPKHKISFPLYTKLQAEEAVSGL